MVVVIALDGEGAKEALHLQGRPAFALLPGLGLAGGVTAVGGWLLQPPRQSPGGLEDRPAHQQFQLLHQLPGRRLALKLGHQSLDFLVLGEEDFGGGGGRPNRGAFCAAHRR